MKAEFTSKDLRLINRGLRSRWAIPEEARQELGQMAYDIAKNSENTKEKLDAIRTLHMLDRTNLKHEEIFTPTVRATFETLTEEELEAKIQELEKELNEKTQEELIQELLTVPVNEEYVPPEATKEVELQPLQPNECRSIIQVTGHHRTVGKKETKEVQRIDNEN